MVLGIHLNGHLDINCAENINPDPKPPIYPQLAPNDSPYQLNEEALRSAISIPNFFQYGKNGRMPVLLVPGTGTYGGEAFQHNFANLLKNSTFGDPVWLNIPGRMCDDATKNAEYVAYAINYISVMCYRKIAVVGWSQGNLSVQWSLAQHSRTGE